MSVYSRLISGTEPLILADEPAQPMTDEDWAEYQEFLDGLRQKADEEATTGSSVTVYEKMPDSALPF